MFNLAIKIGLCFKKNFFLHFFHGKIISSTINHINILIHFALRRVSRVAKKVLSNKIHPLILFRDFNLYWKMFTIEREE